MEMPEPVKKYWPYLLGGAVGLYLFTRASSSGAATSGGSTDYASLVAAQTAQSAQQGQLGLQAASLQDQTQVQLAQIASSNQQSTNSTNASLTVAGYQRDTALAATAAAINDSNNAAQIGFLSAQSQLAANAGAASAAIITSLQAPDIAAINDATALNIATIQAAATASQTAYGATAAISLGNSQQVATAAPAIAGAGGYGTIGAINGLYGMTGAVVGAQSASQTSQTAAEAAATAAKNAAAMKTIGTVAMALAA